MQYYNKFKFGGDTIIEPNMMIQTREAITDNPDTTIIMYSMKPGESRQYQIHRFDSYGDYEVFGIINPNRSKTLPDDTNYDVNIASNTFDNYTYCGFTADSTYASYSTNNYFQNGSSKFTSNYRGFTLVSEGNKELLTARIKFSIYNYNDDNPLNYFRLDAIDGYKNSKNEIIDKQFLSKYFTYDSLTVDSISRDWRRTVYEFDSKVEFVSDFFEFNNKYIILVKDEEANVSLMYSDNRCEKWIKISTPEFNNAGFLKFCYFNKQIYAYNSENLFVTDVASSVGIVSKNEVDIVAYAGNNVLFVKSNENNIRQICLFDILGKEIYSGNFNNNMELKIPINLINYNLLICQVKTQNEVKVLKLIKGEN